MSDELPDALERDDHNWDGFVDYCKCDGIGLESREDWGDWWDIWVASQNSLFERD